MYNTHMIMLLFYFIRWILIIRVGGTTKVRRIHHNTPGTHHKKKVFYQLASLVFGFCTFADVVCRFSLLVAGLPGFSLPVCLPGLPSLVCQFAGLPQNSKPTTWWKPAGPARRLLY